MNKSKFSTLIQLDRELPGTPIIRKNMKGWVNFGRSNDYPDRLIELYFNTIVHKSAIDFAVTSIVGEGLDYEQMKISDDFDFVPNMQYSWEVFIKNIVLDFCLTGSFAFQVIKNKDGRTFSFYHQPIATVRCTPKDEDGNITQFYLCKDWTNPNKFKPQLIDRFSFDEEELRLKSNKPYLFYFNQYTPDIEYYSLPQYIGGIKAIQTEIQLLRYDLRAVTNNFSANGMLVLPRIEDEAEKLQLLKNIKDNFQGVDNANTLLVFFSNGEIDSEITKYLKIDKDTNDVNLFENTNNRTIDRIISAHRIPNKSLLGMPTDSASLGGDGNILNTSWNLYNNTVARENRKTITDTINKMFALNNLDLKLVLKPLNFNITDNANVKEEDDNEDVD